MIFEDFICKFSLSDAMETNQIKRFGQNNMFGKGLLRQHFYKTLV